MVPMVQRVGNTRLPSEKKKRPSALKKCCFTLNNYTEEDIKAFKSTDGTRVPTMAFQEEEEKTPHLQGFVVFNKRTRPIQYFANILGHTRTHIEKMRGTIVENVLYCTSETKRKKGGMVYKRKCPEPLVKMTLGHLTEEQKEIIGKYEEREDPLFGREIHWYWEPDGNWGKTKTCKFLVDQRQAVLVGGKKKDMFYAISQLLLTQGECPPIVCVNLCKDTDMNYVSYAGMEAIKDGVLFSAKFESGMCRFNSPHIIVFANAPPIDRFTKERMQVFPLTDRCDHDMGGVMGWV